LLSAFNYSIKDIMNASVEDLKKVDGIGEKIAEEIYEVLQ
jgi:ERCC4-type nuclease